MARQDETEQRNRIAVQKNGLVIERIRNPSEEVQLLAVSQYGMAIRFIQNPNEAVQLAAIQQIGIAIEHIQKPCSVTQVLAVTKDWTLITRIRRPSKEAKLMAFSCGGGFRAAGHWTKSFRPGARDLTLAIQTSGAPFDTNAPKYSKIVAPNVYKLYTSGVKVIQSCLTNQPAADILSLAEIAPELFEPSELRKILRDALLEQAPSQRVPPPNRSL